MPSIPFYIPDTSPLFIYTPSNSWLGAYRPEGDGWDQTFHTTASGDAIVGINVTASSIRFQLSSSSTTSSLSSKRDESTSCSIEYRINGSDWSDACLPTNNKYLRTDLPFGIHLIELKGKNDNGMEFMGIQGELPIYNTGSAINQTIDDSSSSFGYTNPDQWTSLSSSSNNENYANFTLKTMYEQTGLNGFYGESLSGTTVQGASVDLTFQGEAIYVYGLSGLNCGTAQITLDGQVQHDIDMRNNWETHGSLLYMSGGFNPNDTHTLQILNNQQGEQLIIDYAMVTVPNEEKESHIPLIAGISGGISFFLFCVGICWLLIIRRNKSQNIRSRQQKAQYAFMQGTGKDGLNSAKSSGRSNSSLFSPLTPNSGQSSFVATQGEYVWGTGRPAGLDLTITSNSKSPNPNTPGNGINTATWNVTGLPRSPPPDYPDYIPYKPTTPDTPNGLSSKSAYRPVIPRSSTTPNPMPISSSSPTPLLRSATSASNNGWTHTASPSLKSRSPLLERMNSLTLLSAKGHKPEYDDIALDNYQKPTPITPPPIPAEYGDYTPTTGSNQAHSPFTKSPSTMMTTSPASSIGVQRIATRSSIMSNMARYFPAREAIHSIHRANSDDAISALNNGTAALNSQYSAEVADHGRIIPNGMYYNLPTTTTSQTDNTPKTPKTGISSPRSEVGLTRGLSVKTIDTVKSWLPDFIFATSSTSRLNQNLSSLPSVPSTPNQAARPDSGIFPLALNNNSIRSLPLTNRGTGTGTPNSTQMMPSTATRSFFGNAFTGSGGLINSPSTAKTLGSIGENYTTPKTGNSSYNSSPIVMSGIRGNPAPSRSLTESSGYSYGFSGSGASAGREINGNQMFIELNPNSPIGDSRPGSEFTHVG
ncbi:uncharacterized protein I206_101882 [Kwoniella pini CBS 10737]|uniref:Uncharacterized protein n=1 Tax=Kwoniella pini CBS 10737 TaxID=1296096 RepID=A0A1B9HVG5_9TREE|nr:uncharacterized protein I206_07027 [Kwoniella pini CBS 10737]OCF47249.1 hypothetical protein I206_07027 [Kwoniella pini CBS 10737]